MTIVPCARRSTRYNNGMNSATQTVNGKKFGYRYYFGGFTNVRGWRHPMTRQECWADLKIAQADARVFLIEVFDFEQDKVVWTWKRDLALTAAA